MKEIRQRQEEEKKKVAEAYWAEHAEEKAELETKKADLAGKLDNFTKAIDEQQQKKADLESRIKNFRSPLQIKFVQINKEIDKQQTLYASLGLFKGKEKKQIEDMILALKKSRPKDQEMIAEIDQLLAPLKAELKDVSDEIIRLTNLKTDATKDLAAVEKKLNREAE